MTTTYKVWIQTEKLPHSGDPENISEPDWVFESTSKVRALDMQNSIIDLLAAFEDDDTSRVTYHLNRIAQIMKKEYPNG